MTREKRGVFFTVKPAKLSGSFLAALATMAALALPVAGKVGILVTIAGTAALASGCPQVTGPEDNQYNKDGYDKDGYDKNGYDKNGYDKSGYNRDGYDINGYDHDGFNEEGWDREGYNWNGLDNDGYNRQGYDQQGYDRDGWTMKISTKTPELYMTRKVTTGKGIKTAMI
jgi:hypothetical protein